MARVLPGMQAAFVEMGLARTGFLHASDVLPPPGCASAVPGLEPDIRDLLREGDTVLVQVVKDQLGTKGARLTTFITMPSRYLVLLPGRRPSASPGESKSESERARLKQLDDRPWPATVARHGYIVRTAAEGMGMEPLRADVDFLHRLWEVGGGRRRTHRRRPSCTRTCRSPIRVLRDLVNPETQQGPHRRRAGLRRAAGFRGQRHAGTGRPHRALSGRPADLRSVRHRGRDPKALARKVELKSGGYLVIDQTEALTSIDVNTGGYRGAPEPGRHHLPDQSRGCRRHRPRQLRLRNLGGIIIIDFIDMLEETHRARSWRR